MFYFHLHSTITNGTVIDSTTPFEEFIQLAKEQNCTALAFSEHGSVYEWVKKKEKINKAGMKYVHGLEAYMVVNEFDAEGNKNRESIHVGLYAKNLDGIKEINSLTSKSYKKDDGHFYYKPRILYSELKATSNNVIVTTACLSGLLWEYRNTPGIIIDFMTWAKANKNRVFLEVQHHQHEDQKEYNQMLLNLSKEYGVRIIAGTDTHSSTEGRAKSRLHLQHAKEMFYGHEDSIDLTFKTEYELVEAYIQQQVLSLDDIHEAISNTDVMADMVEDFELDRTFKYPDHIYGNPVMEFQETVERMFEEKIQKGIIPIADKQKYLKRITEEMDAFKIMKMESFMLFMSELITWCWSNNIPVGFNRGSVGGSLVAYIIDIIDLNPLVWNTVFSRFINISRVNLSDIDLDFCPTDRERVYDYIIERFGKEYVSFIITFNTVAERGTVDELIRAKLNMKAKKEGWSKSSDEFKELKVKYYAVGERIKKQIDGGDIELLRTAMPEFMEIYDNLVGCIVSKGRHPAGMIASPITLDDNLGVYTDSEGHVISSCSMKVVDGLNYVKYDILGLKNIGIIKNTFELINSHYLKSHEINWNDQAVWDDMIKHQASIFQFEGNYAFSLLKRFKPQKINDLSLVNACLRPSGASIRDRLISREVHKNPSEEIDELLKDNLGYLVYQEDTIKFLTDICQQTGSQADTTRRNIAKKLKLELQKSLPEILEGYCNHSPKERSIAEKEAKEFLQVIEDSSDYQFGYNHSTGYSMLGYLCAYLRYYYPLEFTTAFFNYAQNDADIIMGKDLASFKSIKVAPVKWGYSKGRYFFDEKTNTIFQGVGSIKGLNETKGDDLFQLAKSKQDKLYDVFYKIQENTSLDKSDMETLIKLNYFEQFGGNETLLELYEIFLLWKRGNIKQIKKDSVGKYVVPEELISMNSTSTEKTYKIHNVDYILNKYFKSKLINDKSVNTIEQIMFEVEMIGFPFTTVEGMKSSDRYIAIGIKEQNTPIIKLFNLKTGELKQAKVFRNRFNKYVIRVGDQIRVYEFQNIIKSRYINGDRFKTEERELFIADYDVYKKAKGG